MSNTYVSDEKMQTFKFNEFSLKSINALTKAYQEALSELEKVSKNPGSYIDETYGVCNNRYKMRYITPHNISAFVAYVGRIINDKPFPVENVNDMEAMSVAMLQRFVNDNKKCVPFEDTNAYGSNAYINQRTITLPKLLVMCNNEFYDTSVYSKADLESRAKAMAEDIKLLTDMKFDKNVDKLVDAIPKVMSDNCPDVKYIPKTKKLVAEVITRFIETACAINLSTVEQMIAYCVPNKSYTIKKEIHNPNKRYDYDYYDEEAFEYSEVDDDYFEESVDLTQFKPIFINLSVGGDNIVSNSIRKATGEIYSHSSISFDINMDKMYTFVMTPVVDDVYKYQNPGFQFESIKSSKFKNRKCTVYCMFVPNSIYDKMYDTAREISKSNGKYDYGAIINKLKALTGGEKATKSDKKNKQICSTFVNAIIAIAGSPMSNNEVPSPGELNRIALIKPRQFFCVYDGTGENYDPEFARERIEEFAQTKSSKPYSECVTESYYTECSLLKTNEIQIRSKIPFNCNMRDIVLQDMHPTFKDTQSAIMFIISDERSPITSLLRKYRTTEKIQPNFRVLNMFMHLRHENAFDDEKNDPYYLANKRGRMHTDPNWLDKITYGNQFLNGNYRSDALGNNKFTPMEETLNHVYSMYCGYGLKTNEELANHIIEVANVMNSIINQYKSGNDGCVCNWEMMRDILAVFGEIFTRAVLKLYDNNSKVFTVSDTMDDTAGPSYMYTESFDMFMEASGPSIKVDSNKTGIAKAWGNARALIMKFVRWVQDTFNKLTGNFEKKFGEQIEWINNNPELNQKIENALNSGFTVNLTNYTPFDVKVDAIKNMHTSKVIQTLIDKNEPITANDIVKGIIGEMGNVEGLDNLQNGPDQNGNLKEYCQNLINFFLYGKASPQPNPNGPMKGEVWNDIVNNIVESSKGVDAAKKGLEVDMTNANNLLKKKIEESKNGGGQSANKENTEESAAPQPPGAEQPNQGQTEQAKPTEPQGDKPQVDWEKALKEYINVTKLLHMGIINGIINTFYMTSYKLYTDVVSAYNTQYTEKQAAPAANGGNA